MSFLFMANKPKGKPSIPLTGFGQTFSHKKLIREYFDLPCGCIIFYDAGPKAKRYTRSMLCCGKHIKKDQVWCV